MYQTILAAQHLQVLIALEGMALRYWITSDMLTERLLVMS